MRLSVSAPPTSGSSGGPQTVTAPPMVGVGSVDGDVALDGGVEPVLQPQRRLADVGREIDLLRDELAQGHAARHLHLAAVQLAAHLVDDEGVLAEGDAAAHVAGGEGQSAQAYFAVLDAEVPEERRSPERAP